MDKMTVPEVAKYLKMSKAKLYDLIKRRKMPHIRIGRTVWIRWSDLTIWLDKHHYKQGSLF